MKSLEIGSSSDTCKSTNVVSCCTHSLGMCLGIPLGILLSPGSRTVSWVLCGYLGARHPLSPVIEGYSTKLKKLDVQEGKKDKLFADHVTQVCEAHNRVIVSIRVIL